VGRGPDGYWIARKIRVTIDFPESEEKSDRAPAEEWNNIYRKVLVNPGDVSKYSRKVQRPEIRVSSPGQSGRSLRIRIPETGLYVLGADSLNSIMGGGPLATGQFALKRYYYDESEPGLYRERDIPMAVIKGENSSSEYFEEDDLLYFHAEGIRDDPAAGDTIAAFTGDHVVWLEENRFGEMMIEGSGIEPGGMPAESSCNSLVHVRRDTYYKKKIKSGARDYYFAAVPGENSVSSSFFCRDVYFEGDFTLTVSLRGVYESDNKNLTFEIRNSRGSFEIGSGTLLGEEVKGFVFGSLPSDSLAEGENTLVISSQSTEFPVLINYFSVEYSRIMNIGDGILEFTLESSPDSIMITGFSEPEGYLAEITGQTGHTIYTLTPEMFSPSGNEYTLSIKFPQPATGRYAVFEKGAGRHIYNRWITEDAASDIKTRTGPYNTLIIAHSDFLPPATDAVSEYVSWREQQGYRILTADVQDVYDEFNGGLPSCSAIKRFIKYGYLNWGVEFVMLVGDASEDHKRLYAGSAGSGPDFVPSYTYAMRMDAIGYDDEVVATDKWYAFIDDDLPFGSPSREKVFDAVNQAGSDIRLPAAPYPDLFVGRVPVSNDIEASRVFLKMRRYEEETANGQWRRNLILFADDAWSGSTADYYYRPSEENFQGSMELTASQLESFFPGGINIERLYLSRWNNDIHTGTTPAENRSIAIDSTREYFNPYLIDRLNEGALFFAFQGHASRVHMTTESGFSMFTRYSDVGKLFSNRNHIYVGLGCHISEFALVKELNQASIAGPGGDCITEHLMNRSGAGSVGAYASSAYEDLIKNNRLCETIFEVIYTSPPSDTMPPGYDLTGARWILGELFTEAEIEHINTRSYGAEQSFRHVLFGDPMLNIDSGPPVMKAQADWGSGLEDIPGDTLVSRSSSNRCDLRFTANDLIALGGITLSVNGRDWTDSLEIVPVNDTGLTYSRGYRAGLNGYRLDSEQRELLFTVVSTGGEALGTKTIYLGETAVRLFYIKNGQEIEVSGRTEVMEGGDYRVRADFPVYLQAPPNVSIDGSELSDILMVPVQGDSAAWEGYFERSFSPGEHDISVSSGDFSSSLVFTVGSEEFTFDTFCFPNPFTGGTNIFFTLAERAGRGRVNIYNVSGTLIRKINIPADMLAASPFDDPGSVYWDGSDMAGNRVANGTYIYIIEVTLPGNTVSLEGKIVKLE
ncbi:MAG: C25 family cysteine peptidase, partial [Candidatus Krumholzibacteriota bacterium]